MKWFLSVILLISIVAGLASKCDLEKGSLMALDIETALEDKIGDIMPLKQYQKDKYVGAAILAADVTHLCKAFVNKFDDLLVISFSDIPIETFDDKVFAETPKLEDLEFDGCKFTHIKTGIFEDMPNMEELEFINTPIVKVDAGAFANLPKLESIQIVKGGLLKIDPAWFKNCPSIVKVDFSGNRIKTINPGDFAFMKSGEEHKIKLTNNKIKTIAPAAFTTKKFSLLNLEGNRLRYLASAMFVNLDKSTKINLAGNSFTCIDENTIKVLKHFKTVVLDDNSVEENCDKKNIIGQLETVEWN